MTFVISTTLVGRKFSALLSVFDSFLVGNFCPDARCAENFVFVRTGSTREKYPKLGCAGREGEAPRNPFADYENNHFSSIRDALQHDESIE